MQDALTGRGAAAVIVLSASRRCKLNKLDRLCLTVTITFMMICCGAISTLAVMAILYPDIPILGATITVTGSAPKPAPEPDRAPEQKRHCFFRFDMVLPGLTVLMLVLHSGTDMAEIVWLDVVNWTCPLLIGFLFVCTHAYIPGFLSPHSGPRLSSDITFIPFASR